MPAATYVASSTWSSPFSVGSIAGRVVYPRSPLMIVPEIVLTNVSDRIPKFAAAHRSGVEVAFTLNVQEMIVAMVISIKKIIDLHRPLFFGK